MTFDFFGEIQTDNLSVPPEKYIAGFTENALPEEFLSLVRGEIPIAFNDKSLPVAVISGAGLMGCSIAAAFLLYRLPILLFDIDEQALQRAPLRIQAELQLQMPEAIPNDIEQLITDYLHLNSDRSAIKEIPFILETIPEKLKLKQKHYRQLDAFISPGSVLVSNTSTIRITDLSDIFEEKCKNITAQSFCGFHFFHPVRRRSLVEIIRGQKTSTETLNQAIQMARRIHKTPVLVNDGPGFLVNRLLNPYLSESLILLEEGVPMARIEAVCRRFGMEMGPFRIMDEIGLEVALHSGWSIYKENPELVTSILLLPMMIEQGRLGRKSGRGFYRYTANETSWQTEPEKDDTLEELLGQVHAQQPKYRLENVAMSDEQIGARIFLSILLEAGRIIEAGTVSSFKMIDMALVLGLGYPRSKGGICYWADSKGLDFLLTEAKKLESLGKRFAIPDILKKISSTGRKLV